MMPELPAGLAEWVTKPGPSALLDAVRLRVQRSQRTESGTLSTLELSVNQRREIGLMLGVVRSTWVRASVVAVSAGLVAFGVVAAIGAEAAGVNRRPVCNNTYFNVPAAVGASVHVRVLDFAADPDLTPVRLVSVFDVGWPRLGTVVISDSGTPGVPGDDVLVFTRTENTGTASLYWTVTDGSLTAQCSAYASNVPPPENG